MRNLLKVSLVSLALVACSEDPPQVAQGELEVDENSLDFGQACPRPTAPELKVEESQRSLHIRNVGRGALTLNQFSVEEGKQELFVFDQSKIPGELASLEELEVPITFVPNGAGTTIADLTIVGDDETKPPFVVKLIGEGKSAPPNPGVVVGCRGGKFDSDANPNDTCAERDPVSNVEKLRENANFFFRDAPAGEIVVSSFKIRNTGCPTLEVTGIAVTTDTAFGADPATYALDAGQKDSLAIVNGAEGEIKVAFNPKIADAFDGTLTFTTNDPANKTVSIPLKGLGIEPQIVALPQQCDLRTPGSCNGKLTLRNSGDQDLTLGDITLEKGSENFKIATKPPSGTVIPSAANGNNALVDAVTIEYTPDINADVNDYVVINSNAGQARVLLRGGSFPVLKTDPDFEVDFGVGLDPTKKHYKPITIRNFATWYKQLPLTIKSFTADGAASQYFKLAADPANSTACPAPLAPNTSIANGQDRVVCAEFAPPSQGGEYSQDFVIESDDPLWSTVPYRLTFKGIATCDFDPVAEITVPGTVACGTGQPCTGQSKCINGFCHATGSYTHSLSSGGAELEISCAASHDLVGPACNQPDPSKISACDWDLRVRPSGSTATLTPSGRTSQNYTKLNIDKVGAYNVRLFAFDPANNQSAASTFTINVVP